MNGLLKTLIKLDWDESPKRSEILRASNLFQIGEFQLIQLAYKVWCNKELAEKRIVYPELYKKDEVYGWKLKE